MAALDDINGVEIVYLAKICPPTEGQSVQLVENVLEEVILPDSETEKKMRKISCAGKRATFTELQEGVKYSIKITTMVNGKSLCQVKLRDTLKAIYA